MKIVKCTRYVAACALIVLCEMAFGSYIKIGGVVPMLGFCFCITAAFFERDLNFIVAVGAVMGALCDCLFGHGFGTYTVLFALSALAVFYVRDKVFSSRIIMLAACAFIMSLAANAVYYVFHITEIGGGFFGVFLSIILPSGVYNTAVSLMFYPAVKRILGKRG